MQRIRNPFARHACVASATLLLCLGCSAPDGRVSSKGSQAERTVAPGIDTLRDDTPDCVLTSGAEISAEEGCPDEVTNSEAADEPVYGFEFEEVRARARQLAEQDYIDPNRPMADIPNLDYDQYRRIQNTQASALWVGPEDAFRVMLDPRGYLFNLALAINLIEPDGVKARPYSAADFDFKDLPLSETAKETLGFAGFRILTELNEAGKFDELVSFKGASFFRALGSGNVYGASARGLAIGTASPDGEEFPHFSEFWLVKPVDGASSIKVYALMDGKSITGAFGFNISAGPETRTDVTATFFPRREIGSVGIAPLTSMYFFSPHDLRKQADDFRPAVHDSEGLSINMANGEWVWRPLINPKSLQISVLATDSPRGFGLLQRKRALDDYADTEAEYHHRPNVWIQPESDWGSGALSLVEIPTANEYNDNVVVFWRPADAWQPGQSYDLKYSMQWSQNQPVGMTVIPVAETRSGKTPDRRRQLFVIDFEPKGGAIADGVEASISTSAGEIYNPIIKRDQETGKTRLTFELDPESEPVAELRALLTLDGAPVSETWLYRWRAE